MMKYLTEEFPEYGQEMMDVALKRNQRIIESKIELESALSALEKSDSSTSMRESSIKAERISRRKKSVQCGNRVYPMI